MRYLWTVSLLVIILMGNIFYVFQDVGFFHRQFVQLWSYERQENVMEEAKILMNYWRNDDVLVSSDVYTQAEKEHLYDVKKLLVVLWYIFVAIVCLFLVFSVWLWWKSLFEFATIFGAFGMTVIGFVLCGVVLFVVSWVAWDWLFDLFHRTFFVDNWLFPGDSFLIQSYPWEFFRHGMVVVLGRSLGLLLLIRVVLWGIAKKPRRA